MVARFLGCAVVTHWLLHTAIQIFFCLVLVHKIFWCYLSSLGIQTRVFAMTFCITLTYLRSIHWHNLKAKLIHFISGFKMNVGGS